MFRRYSSLIAIHKQLYLAANDICLPKIQTAYFRSHMSIDKIYPNSNQDFLRDGTDVLKSEIMAGRDSKDKDKFSGYIPIDQLEISATRSSGPGGQNVNTVNSKVEIRFHLDSASWIPDWVKPRLAVQAAGRITKDGYLVVRSDMTRKQILNQADCINKLRNLIFAAYHLPKEPTKEEIKIKEDRMAKAKAGILREKRKKSLLKNERSQPETL